MERASHCVLRAGKSGPMPGRGTTRSNLTRHFGRSRADDHGIRIPSPQPTGERASFWLVVGWSCDPVRAVDAVVHEVRDHALGSVFEVVAVVHPDAGVVGHEGDVVGLVSQDVERVNPPRASDGRYPVAGQYDHMMAMQVHRMHLAAA